MFTNETQPWAVDEGLLVVGGVEGEERGPGMKQPDRERAGASPDIRVSSCLCPSLRVSVSCSVYGRPQAPALLGSETSSPANFWT